MGCDDNGCDFENRHDFAYRTPLRLRFAAYGLVLCPILIVTAFVWQGLLMKGLLTEMREVAAELEKPGADVPALAKRLKAVAEEDH